MNYRLSSFLTNFRTHVFGPRNDSNVKKMIEQQSVPLSKMVSRTLQRIQRRNNASKRKFVEISPTTPANNDDADDVSDKDDKQEKQGEDLWMCLVELAREKWSCVHTYYVTATEKFISTFIQYTVHVCYKL